MAAWNYLSNKMQCYVLYTTVVAVALCFSTMPCNASQIPARFFYHNQDISQDLPQTATHEELVGTDYAPDSAAHGTNTNVRLLRDTGTKPLEFYKELSNVTDVAEFIERFVDKDSIDPQLGLVENIKRSVERAAAINAQPAICMPEKQIVPLLPLTPSIDPDIIYFPSCTRVKRCGGCCNHALMSCQPTESKVNNYKILKFNTQNTRVLGQEVVAVEEHLKCACNCNIKAEDCNAYQTYDLSRCMCICNNADARSKCSGEENKIWDEQKCRCVCRENISCSTGTFYDHNDCTCVKSGHGDDAVAPPSLDFFDRKRFIVKATAIEQDNSTLYETV